MLKRLAQIMEANKAQHRHCFVGWKCAILDGLQVKMVRKFMITGK